MNQRALHFYEFGPFRLNLTERILYRGSEMVALTPKVLDTLLVLVENNGHILEKNELMEHLWPDSFVEESSLTQNISLLRRALAEGDSENNYIETIPKRGYRFNAVVNELDELTNGHAIKTVEASPVAEQSSPLETPVPLPPRRNVYPIAIVGVVVLALLLSVVYWFRFRNNGERFVPRSVAVLPFKTIGTNSENDLLGLGMADALIIKLSRLDQLSVLPTSSIFRYTERDKDPVAIGRELDVESVLDGTVQRDGEWVRVTAQLIRLSDGKTVWSGKFDERYSSIFTLQDSVSEQLAGSLRPQLTQSDKNALSVHSTDNTEAYEPYITGLYFWNRRTRENLPKAIAHLEQAVAIDPNFAEARAILADCYYLSMQDEYGRTDPDEALKRAEISVTKALELNDSLAAAHTVKAGLKMAERNFDEAGREFQRALELNPNYAVAHLRYAYYLYYELKLDQALVHMRRAQQLDPVSSITNGALAGMLYHARDFDTSIVYSKRALELEPTQDAAGLNLSEAYIQKRMFREAHENLDQWLGRNPRYVYWEKAYAYALEGRREDCMRMLAEVEKINTSGMRNHINYGVVYGALGDKDKAFNDLNEIRPNRFISATLKYEAQLDPLRDDPRFNELLKKHQVD
ncbi:MAG: hypothetical protein DMF69_01225 [Acidobacteria bacterium]|nr:MAG: hypothetical protein DMF69_01225 [Acidobacteriota bacterium]